MLKENEVLDSLLIDNFKIIQNASLYKMTSDSVHLSNFAKVKKNDVVADFCAGSGIVGLDFYVKNKRLVKCVDFFEMQYALFDMCKRSIELNSLSENLTAYNLKIQEIPPSFNDKYSLILCNPPYFDSAKIKIEQNEISVCKYDFTLKLNELIGAIKLKLKFGGRACIIYPANRLVDLISTMRNFKIEPKKLQLIKNKNSTPHLALIEGVKGGKEELKILKDLVL